MPWIGLTSKIADKHCSVFASFSRLTAGSLADLAGRDLGGVVVLEGGLVRDLAVCVGETREGIRVERRRVSDL